VQNGRLVCIRCRGRLSSADQQLVCEDCRATYPVLSDVPVLLPEALTAQQQGQTRYFDAEFAAYERYELENWRRSYIERIFRELGIEAGRGPYLDVGVGGSGATVIEAARLGVEATGCDLSVEGVQRADRFARMESLADRAHFVVCAAESLPFPDGSFVCASAVALLEHVDDDSAAASELGRVLRPGGRLWVTVPLAWRYVPPPLWPVYRRHDRKLGHKRHYDEGGLVRLLDGAGFSHESTFYTGHPVKLVQLAAHRLVPASSVARHRLWWTLERADLRAAKRPWGALQLSAVFRRE
jgi:SAM-dependent methyltransferase